MQKSSNVQPCLENDELTAEYAVRGETGTPEKPV